MLCDTMPKADKTTSHRNSSVSSTPGGGTRSSSWPTKDDETLIKARAQGLNWNQIAPKHFPAKSPNACRKRHERLMEKQNAEQWDGVKLEVLAQAYMDVRREMWSLLANKIGEKWPLVEQKCMEKGFKNLNQAYRSAQRKMASDSGVSISEGDEDDRLADLPLNMESNYPQYSSYATQTARVSSIQSLLQPSQMAVYPDLPHYQQQQHP